MFDLLHACAFCVAAGDLNSGPDACSVSSLNHWITSPDYDLYYFLSLFFLIQFTSQLPCSFLLSSQSHPYKSLPPLPLHFSLGYHPSLEYLVPAGLGIFSPTEAQPGSAGGVKEIQCQGTETETGPASLVKGTDTHAKLLDICDLCDFQRHTGLAFISFLQ